MPAGFFLDELTPISRVAIALAPFLAALVFRLAFGRGNLTRWLITLATMWFAINVLLAPFASGLVQEMINVRSLFH